MLRLLLSVFSHMVIALILYPCDASENCADGRPCACDAGEIKHCAQSAQTMEVTGHLCSFGDPYEPYRLAYGLAFGSTDLLVASPSLSQYFEPLPIRRMSMIALFGVSRRRVQCVSVQRANL